MLNAVPGAANITPVQWLSDVPEATDTTPVQWLSAVSGAANITPVQCLSAVPGAVDSEYVFSDGERAVVPDQQKLEYSISHPTQCITANTLLT